MRELIYKAKSSRTFNGRRIFKKSKTVKRFDVSKFQDLKILGKPIREINNTIGKYPKKIISS